MTEILKTVTVKGQIGPVRINEDEFNPEIHVLYEEAEKQPEIDPMKISTQPKVPIAVARNGKRGAGSKFILVDENGEQADVREFDTDVEASEALKEQK